MIETSETKIEFIPQNASGLYLDMQKIGCFYRAACHMAELVTGHVLTVAELNSLWDYAKKCKFIDSDLNVKNSAGIANNALTMLGGKGKFVEVATFQNGEMNYYASVKPQDRHAEYFIQKILQGGPSRTHFTNVKSDGSLLWDPHDPQIKKLSIYYTICYRYDQE